MRERVSLAGQGMGDQKHRRLRAGADPSLAKVRSRYLPNDQHGANLLFQVISQGYERGSSYRMKNKAEG